MANQIDYPAKLALEDGSGFYLLEDSSGDYINELQDYANLILSDGAFAYWRMDEATGNITDLVGGYILAPFSSSSVFTYSQPGALVGDADTGIYDPGVAPARFDGTTTGLNFSLATHPSMTFECWINYSGGGGGAPLAFLHSGNDWQIQLIDSGGVAFSMQVIFVGTGGNLTSMFSRIQYAPGTWLHFVVVLDSGSSTTYLYANGSNLDFFGSPMTQAWTNTPAVAFAGGVLSLMAINDSQTTFGTMDEVAFYPTALTADQVARHYAAGLQYFPNEVASIPSQMVQLLPQ